jgi:hypothetical protein
LTDSPRQTEWICVADSFVYMQFKEETTNYPCTSRIEFSDTSGIYSVLLNVYVEDNKILIWFSLKLKMTYLDWCRAMHYIRCFFFFWGSTSVESFGEPEVSGELLY